MKNSVLIKGVIILLSFSLFQQVVRGQENWTVKNVSNSGLINNQVSKIFEDQTGKIWIGTRKGLNSVKDVNWDTFSKSNGMSHNVVTDIIEDKNGKIWVTTLKGISVFEDTDMTILNKKDGLVHNKVYSIESDSKGNIWVGTKKGVSVYDGQNWKVYNKKNGLIHNLVLDIMEDVNGNMWFATRIGVSMFDGVNWKSFTKEDGLARNVTMSIAEDSNGKVWFGNLNGSFSSYNGSDWENIKKGSGYYNYTYLQSGALMGVVYTLIGGPGLGGFMFIAFAATGALPTQPTMVYLDANDNLWLSAQANGVYKSNGQDWTQITMDNGLPHNRVTSILETSKGDIWFGTLKGIAVLNK